MARAFLLEHRDFARYWLGHFVSVLGTQMTHAAVSWQMYELTRGVPGAAEVALGNIGLARAVPLIVLGVFSGAVADAFDRRRVLIVTQSGLLLLSAALALATWTGNVTPGLLYAVTALGGVMTAFDLPARSALVPNLVPREALPRALSIQITTFQLAVILGPGVGTLLIAWTKSTAPVYAIDAATFLVMIVALATVAYARPKDAPVLRIGVAAGLEGLRFVYRTPALWATTMIDFLATFFAGCMELMPIFAAEIFGVGVAGLGPLRAAPGVGAFVTAFVLTMLPPIRRQGLAVLVSVACFGLATAAFGFSPWYGVGLVCLALSGAADTVSMVVRHTIRQEVTPDAVRGRMVAVNMIFFVGGPLLGEFEAGYLARYTSARTSVVVGGLACIAMIAFYALWAPWLRRYVREAPPAAKPT